MAAACRGVQLSLSRALTVAPASSSCCTISRKSSMQLCKPGSLSTRPAPSTPPAPSQLHPPSPCRAHLVQGRQTILVGQVWADPALKELADCKKEAGVLRGQEWRSCHRPALSWAGPAPEVTWLTAVLWRRRTRKMVVQVAGGLCLQPPAGPTLPKSWRSTPQTPRCTPSCVSTVALGSRLPHSGLGVGTLLQPPHVPCLPPSLPHRPLAPTKAHPWYLPLPPHTAGSQPCCSLECGLRCQACAPGLPRSRTGRALTPLQRPHLGPRPLPRSPLTSLWPGPPWGCL